MQDSDFEFWSEEFHGCCLIHAVIPAEVSVANLSVAVSTYLALWDVELPIVVLNDATRLEPLPEDVGRVLLAIMKRNAAHPRFIGSAWVTSASEVLDKQLRDLLIEAGRDPETIFDAERAALDFLRALIENRDHEN